MIDKEYKRAVLETISLIADPEAQIQYEKDVPIAHIPSELICIWFDDRYHPGTKVFNATFTEEERKILKDFNQEYDSLLKNVSEEAESGTVLDLHKDKYWCEIMNIAKQTLRKLQNV